MSKVKFQTLIYPLLVEVQTCWDVLGHSEAAAPYMIEKAWENQDLPCSRQAASIHSHWYWSALASSISNKTGILSDISDMLQRQTGGLPEADD